MTILTLTSITHSRGGSSQFIVPYNRFMKSLANSFSPGVRFKMRVETEDAEDRRFEIVYDS